jgi:hypothetical protein
VIAVAAGFLAFFNLALAAVLARLAPHRARAAVIVAIGLAALAAGFAIAGAKRWDGCRDGTRLTGQLRESGKESETDRLIRIYGGERSARETEACPDAVMGVRDPF